MVTELLLSAVMIPEIISKIATLELSLVPTYSGQLSSDKYRRRDKLGVLSSRFLFGFLTELVG